MSYKYWLIGYKADTTETGCTTSIAYVRTTWGADPSGEYCALYDDLVRENAKLREMLTR